MTLVFMFPGQSSRYPGMLEKLVELHPDNADTVARASEALGRDLRAQYAEGNAEAFARNRDIQIGVFLANHLFLRTLQREGIDADYSLGLSLGEWNHLVHIGALPFDQALLAVEQRGLAYDAGPRGMMASVFPISAEELAEVAARVGDRGVVEVVNLNSPRQQVLSGDAPALEAALELLEEEFYVQATIIERQVPMHASTFAPVGQRFAEYLATLAFQSPTRPYFPNRIAQLVEKPTKEQYVELLSTHVCRPVLWRKSVDLLVERHPEAVFVEVGPRRVLFNLLDRKWHRGLRKHHVDSKEETAEHLQQLVSALREDRGEAPQTASE